MNSSQSIKKGDLVILINATNSDCFPFLGQIRTVAQRCPKYKNSWELDPPTVCSDGWLISWDEIHLQKIDPPATGEYDRVPVRKTQPQKELV